MKLLAEQAVPLEQSPSTVEVPLDQRSRKDWPNLRELAQPFFDRPYADGECWSLICELLQAGGFLDDAMDPIKACQRVQQIWWHDNPRDPFTLVQPWDWLLLRNRECWVEHPALVVDGMDMIHVHRKAGVRIEPMRRRRHLLLQVARLRCLC